jgi:hypothetical protein
MDALPHSSSLLSDGVDLINDDTPDPRRPDAGEGGVQEHFGQDVRDLRSQKASVHERRATRFETYRDEDLTVLGVVDTVIAGMDSPH